MLIGWIVLYQFSIEVGGQFDVRIATVHIELGDRLVSDINTFYLTGVFCPGCVEPRRSARPRGLPQRYGTPPDPGTYPLMPLNRIES